jgi:uncharacterized membrane protein YeaQ/YmgE (transglycosylase-associated protein family)
MSWIWWIIIGALSGWIAGKLMRGGGFGFVVNFVVGIIGAVIGGWIFDILQISADEKIGSLVTSVVGAVAFLWIVSLFKKKE